MASSEAALVRSLWCPLEEAEDRDMKRGRRRGRLERLIVHPLPEEDWQGKVV